MATNGGDLKNIKQFSSLYLHQNWLQKRVRLCKDTNHFSLWAPWEKLSGLRSVSLTIHGLPVRTAKKEKRSHGQACCQHRMFYPAAGWARNKTAQPLLKLPIKGGPRRCQNVFCNNLLQRCLELHKIQIQQLLVVFTMKWTLCEALCQAFCMPSFFKTHNNLTAP